MNSFTTVVVSALSLLLAVGSARADPPRALTLGEAVALALAKSPDLAAAQHRLEAARAGLAQTEAPFWPLLRLSQTYAASDNPVQAFMMTLNQRAFSLSGDFNHPRTTDNFNTKALAVYSLYNGGRDAAARQAARLGADAQQSVLAAARNQLVFEVVRAFYEIHKARRFVAVAEAAQASMAGNRQVATDRLAAGTVLKSDVLDAEVRLAQAGEDVVRAHNARALAAAWFRTVLGVGDAENVTAAEDVLQPDDVRRGAPDPAVNADHQVSQNAGDLRSAESARSGDRRPTAGDRRTTAGAGSGDPRPAAPSVSVDEAAGSLDISGRPELAVAQKAVAVAERRRRAAWGGQLPRVNAFASYDLDSGDLDRFADSWVAGVSVEVDVFDGFLTRGRVAEAQAQLEAARAQLRQVELQLQWEARQAQLNLDEAAARLATTGRAVAQAEESRQITQERYRSGLALLTQVLDAETALSLARQRRVAAEMDERIAAAAVRQARGQGWEE